MGKEFSLPNQAIIQPSNPRADDPGRAGKESGDAISTLAAGGLLLASKRTNFCLTEASSVLHGLSTVSARSLHGPVVRSPAARHLRSQPWKWLQRPLCRRLWCTRR